MYFHCLISAEARTFCRAGGTDCDYLGKLHCMTGQCNKGICGCPRGEVAKYLGSEQLFQCVPCKYLWVKVIENMNYCL